MNRVLVIGARGIPGVEGGAEKNAEAIFPRLVAKGYDVTLLALRDYTRCLSFKGVKIVAVSGPRIAKTDKVAAYIYAIYLVGKLRPDYIHLQGLGSALFLLLYRLSGAKIIVRYGSADYTVSKWGVLGRAAFRYCEWQLRFAHAVISVTPALTNRLKSRGIVDNVHTIPNALDIPFESKDRPERGDTIVYIGRITQQKNILILLKAFSLFRERNKGFQLILVGGVDDSKYYETLKEHASEHVTFAGRVSREEIPNILNAAKLFINISTHEGNSNATLEAISHSVPILVSDIPENRDLKLPQMNYVKPDDVQDIAGRMESAVRCPEKYIVNTDSFLKWESVADMTAKVYENIRD